MHRDLASLERGERPRKSRAKILVAAVSLLLLAIARIFFFFNHTPPTEIYTTEDTLSLHDALPISSRSSATRARGRAAIATSTRASRSGRSNSRSEEHTSELQSPSVSSYAVFC